MTIALLRIFLVAIELNLLDEVTRCAQDLIKESLMLDCSRLSLISGNQPLSSWKSHTHCQRRWRHASSKGLTNHDALNKIESFLPMCSSCTHKCACWEFLIHLFSLFYYNPFVISSEIKRQECWFKTVLDQS